MKPKEQIESMLWVVYQARLKQKLDPFDIIANFSCGRMKDKEPLYPVLWNLFWEQITGDLYFEIKTILQDANQ